MKTGLLAVLASGALLAAPGRARADIDVLPSDDADLNFGAMAQVLGFGQLVKDPAKNDLRAYLFLKEARLRSSGHYKDFGFNLELALGGENTVVAPNPGVTLGLLDFSFDIPLHVLGRSYLKVGQFKVPYGRERLTYSGDTQFVERSVQDLGFRVGRDVGAAVTLLPGKATVIAGIFTGGGRDIPTRYLPEKIGVPLLVIRAGFGDVDVNPYELKQTELGVDHPKFAVFVNGLYTKDSLVGHSSALNVKLADKSLLLNSNWNPYIGRQPLVQGEYWQAGADAALRAPIGRAALAAEIEVNYAGYSNKYGSLHTVGGRAQGGVSYKSVELALRYAVLVPDADFSNSGKSITGPAPIQEVTPALTWYLRGQNLKLVADLPILLKVPVFIEPGVGAYVGTDIPDEAALLAKTGTVERQNVIEGRLMLQGRF